MKMNKMTVPLQQIRHLGSCERVKLCLISSKYTKLIKTPQNRVSRN